MRLEQTEDWNPMEEMVKNFGGKRALPSGDAAMSAGFLKMPEVT